MSSIIKIENMSFSYDNAPILKDISLDIHENDFVGIIGPNGGGKTTLLKILLGFLKPTSGNVSILGSAPEQVSKFIGYVPQYSEMDKQFPIRVKDVIVMGLCESSSYFPRFSKHSYEKVFEVMELLKIRELAEKKFGELSGGQKQRTLICRAIVSNPKMLFLDEPTASVDASIEEDIYKILSGFNSKITILLVSHDVGFISNYVNRVACVNRSLVIHPVNEISSDHALAHAYDNHTTAIHHKCGL